ncbi:MAG: hypothetical protein V1734_03365 [Nanoarchaeota archaeon]
MKTFRITGLTDDEKQYLANLLDNYRAKKQKAQSLDNFYASIMQANGFDAVGRFSSYFETGLERVVWVIEDERKEGFAAFVPYEEGDKITLLDGNGVKLKGPLTLDSANAVWADYFEICKNLGIDPKDDCKYLAGLTKKK